MSIGVGILRYRLYDIDRIISRTLAYALVTGLLVGVYGGLVLLATEVRARYDADAAVEAFATRLAGAVALPEVRADLLAVVGGALEPAHLAVWIAESGS